MVSTAMKLREEGRKEERAKFEKERIQTVKKMLENGLDIRMISRCTGLSLEEIEKLK